MCCCFHYCIVVRLLNQQSDDASGGNTALHIAAGNVNVTREFLRAMKSANAKVENGAGDTPFHVAARSTNPNAIIYMLNVFAPSKGGWDIDDLEEYRDEKASTLLCICARNGNATAVSLLIQHGADLATGVLHEIVIESVRSRHFHVLETPVQNSRWTFCRFYPRDAMLARVFATATCLSVCPSVSVWTSVTRRYCA